MFSLKKNWSLVLIAFVFGFLFSVQLVNVQQKKTVSIDASASFKENSPELVSKLGNTALIESGACPVTGPGVVLTIADSDEKAVNFSNPNVYVVHDEDMLNIINELRAAGAEAISLNGHRLVATSEIRCAGPTISVNNERSGPPFVIKAIGNPKTMVAALKMRGGIVETLSVWGIKVAIKMQDKIVIPAYTKNGTFRYARAENGGEKK